MHGCLHTLEVVLCAFRGVAIFVPRSTCQNLSLVTLRTVPTAAQSLFCFRCCVVGIGCCAHMRRSYCAAVLAFSTCFERCLPQNRAASYSLHAPCACGTADYNLNSGMLLLCNMLLACAGQENSTAAAACGVCIGAVVPRVLHGWGLCFGCCRQSGALHGCS